MASTASTSGAVPVDAEAAAPAAGSEAGSVAVPVPPPRPRRAARRAAAALAAALALALAATWVVRGSAAFWSWRGDSLVRASRLVDAENSYNRALDIDPARAQAMYGLGWAYLLAGLRGEARAQFRRCAEVDPAYFGCQRGLGVLALEDSAVMVAEKHLRRAWELAPDDPGVLSSLADLYTRAGRFDEAEDLHRRAIAAEPYRGEYRIAYAETLFARNDLGRCERALAEAEPMAFREVRFRVAVHELRARVELFRAAALLDAGAGSALAPDDRSRVAAHLDRAEEHLVAASALGLERAALTRVRRAVERRREQLLGPSAAPPTPEPAP